MENNVLHEMSVELLKMESKWTNLIRNKPKERPLPDVEAAKERIRQARKKRTGGCVLVIVTVLFYLLVNPRLKAYKEAMEAEGGFALSPTVFKLLFWFVMFMLFCGDVILCLTMIDSKDLKAAETFEKNKKFNDDAASQFAADMAKMEAEHKELVEKLNREAGTKLGEDSPRYFFQIPFDPKKTYEDFKSGIEFYSAAFRGTELVEPLGLTVTGTAPVIHKPKGKRYQRFDGFYDQKACTVREALSLLEKGGYSVLFQDEAYLREHPEERVWMQCIWDTDSRPVENQGYFEIKDIPLESWLREATDQWSELEQFMGSGIPEYEPYVKVNASSMKDMRSENYQMIAPPIAYEDEGRFASPNMPFRLVNAKKTTILEKGYLLYRDGDNRILYAALTDHPVYMRRINFNCALLDWVTYPRFHGWLAGVAKAGAPKVPDKASTIHYICNNLYECMPDFDASAERPDGLTDGQYRLWMECWRLSTVWKKQKLEKKAQEKSKP